MKVGSYTCDLETFIVVGNSKAPNFLLMHLSFVIGAGGFYILLKSLHGKNVLQVLTERVQFDYRRSFFALSIFFVLAGISLSANLILDPSALKFRGDGSDLLIISLLALIFVPIQAGLEEAFFRGYLLQGFSLLIKSRVGILILTSMIFASLHLLNPEPWSYGLFPYILSIFFVGLFMGLITLADGGVELAIGIHVANNLWVHLILGLEDSVIPSSSLLVNVDQELDLTSTIIPSLIQYTVLTGIFALKYKWLGKLRQYTDY
ncbi:CPBP family intramembrane metalloprotease [Chloroflexi bacterium]|nr:CPBP family intramembrane metalloprotease [Chloroflexota bacterium]